MFSINLRPKIKAGFSLVSKIQNYNTEFVQPLREKATFIGYSIGFLLACHLTYFSNLNSKQELAFPTV